MFVYFTDNESIGKYFMPCGVQRGHNGHFDHFRVWDCMFRAGFETNS